MATPLQYGHTNPLIYGKVASDRIFGLDLLRAIAILSVVFVHGLAFLPPAVKAVIDKYFHIDGVTLFFVLSGYLVGHILLKEITLKGFKPDVLLDFWKRRWLRTLPPYFLILFVVITFSYCYTPAFTIKSIWKYFFFLQNVYTPIPRFFEESWSLSVEEWFYITVPLLCFLTGKFWKTNVQIAVMTAIIVVIGFSIGIRCFRYFTEVITTTSEYDAVFRKQVITRLDSIIYGFLGAYISFYYKKTWQKYKSILLYMGLFVFVFGEITQLYAQSIPIWYWTILRFVVEPVSILLMLPYLSEWKDSKGWCYTAVTQISLISYSMYLLHFTVIQDLIINKLINWNYFMNSSNTIAISKYGFYWLLIFLLSYFMYTYFERPILRWRDNSR